MRTQPLQAFQVFHNIRSDSMGWCCYHGKRTFSVEITGSGYVIAPAWVPIKVLRHHVASILVSERDLKQAGFVVKYAK